MWRIVHEKDKHRFDRSRSHGGRPCARPGREERERQAEPRIPARRAPAISSAASRAIPERPPQAARARIPAAPGVLLARRPRAIWATPTTARNEIVHRHLNRNGGVCPAVFILPRENKRGPGSAGWPIYSEAAKRRFRVPGLELQTPEEDEEKLPRLPRVSAPRERAPPYLIQWLQRSVCRPRGRRIDKANL